MEMTDILGRSDKREVAGRGESYLQSTSTLLENNDQQTRKRQFENVDDGKLGASSPSSKRTRVASKSSKTTVRADRSEEMVRRAATEEKGLGYASQETE